MYIICGAAARIARVLSAPYRHVFLDFYTIVCLDRVLSKFERRLLNPYAATALHVATRNVAAMITTFSLPSFF